MKKNLMIIVPQLNIGGGEKQLLLHLKYLNQDKYNIFLLNLDGSANALEDEFNQVLNNQVINLYDKSKFAIVKKIIAEIKINKIDIVHTWLNNDWGRIAAIYCKFIFNQNINIIASERNDMFMSNRRFSSFFIYINYILSFFSNFVTFNSEVPIEKLNKFLYNKKSIIFIPNGIEITQNKYKKSSSNSILTLTIVARLDKIKNHIFLLESINSYKEKSRIILNIVGNGKEYNRLQDFVTVNSMKNVVFHGEIKDPKKIMESTDIGVLVSKSEGFSNAILEYMLYGKAIIATDVGSNKLCVTDNGFLIEDTTSFHEVLDSYLHNKTLLEKHKRNSLKNVMQFDIKKVALEYEGLYDAI